MSEIERLWAYIAVLRRKLDGANRAVRDQRLRADALEPGWAIKWDRRLSRERGLEAERDELRAVLAPLLNEQTRRDGVHVWVWCPCCGRVAALGRVVEHKPDCPVLRRDALLGQDATT